MKSNLQFTINNFQLLKPGCTLIANGVSDKRKHFRGFTLMEILIAAGIFSGVIVAGVAFYATTLKNAEQNRLQREISQIGRTLLEEIERETRSSYGSFNRNGIRVQQAFRIDNGSVSVPAASSVCPALPSGSGTIGNGLTLYRQIERNPTVLEMKYQLVPGPSPGTFRVERVVSESTNFGSSFTPLRRETILPEASLLFAPDALCFRGYFPTSTSQIQPYLEVRLELKNREFLSGGRGRRVSQEFKTLVTSRDTQVRY